MANSIATIDVIKSSLRLIGQLAESEDPSAATVQDSLYAMSVMIDSWSTEKLSTFVTQDQTYLWPAGTKSIDIGPTGAFGGNRPIQIDDATYFRDPQTNVSFGIKIINQQQYDGIAVKTVTSTYPQVMWVNMGYPNITATIYPVPTRILEWHFISVQPLDNGYGILSAGTPLYFPPGYLRAFKYCLACELAPEFGVEPSPTVQRIAMVAKRNLKRINNPDDIMSMPYSIVASRQRFNIYSGNY
jgi:hypothetical protein